jgi:hypothetical protein
MAQRTGMRDVSPVVAEAGGPSTKGPLNPYLVLVVAVLLPGVGQLLNNTPKRAIMFLFFMMSLGWITSHLAPPGASFVGRYAGGFLIYAISVMDAYRWARYRWEFFRRKAEPGDHG